MSRNSGGYFFAFLVGIITGGILGLLFAPEKGSSTRDKLSYLLDKYKSQLETKVKEYREGKVVFSNEAKSEGQKVVSDAKNKAEQLLDDVNSLMKRIKNN